MKVIIEQDFINHENIDKGSCVMSTIHLRKLIAILVRENGQRDTIIEKLEERIGVLENKLNEMKKPILGL
jgi:hypothetical protein